MSYIITFQHSLQCPHPNPSHCEGFCTTRSESFALFVSSDSFLIAFSQILVVVELAIAEMACVSRNIRRTFHVPSDVPIQRSISERDCSHPVFNELPFLVRFLIRLVLLGSMLASYPFLLKVFLGFHCP